MASPEVVALYKSWRHEGRRANYFGKMNYKAACHEEETLMVQANPELASEDCVCGQCQSGVFTA